MNHSTRTWPGVPLTAVLTAVVLLLAAPVLLGAQQDEGDDDEEDDDGDDTGTDDDGEDTEPADTPDDSGEWKPVKDTRPAEDWKPMDEKRADEKWKSIDRPDSLNWYSDYPNGVYFQLGFHYLADFTLEDGREAGKDEVPDEAAFRYELYDEFSPGMIAQAEFEIGYHYRVHKYFNVATGVGFGTQRLERQIEIADNPAIVRYSYMAVSLVAMPEVRVPLSMFDLFIGVGGQGIWYEFESMIRGSTLQVFDDGTPADGDGYRIDDRASSLAVGVIASAGVEYRIRDNWGLSLMYRYAYVPTDFRGNTFDHGGHYGFLGNLFHF